MDYPIQESSTTKNKQKFSSNSFDMRDWLMPKRLTMLMWDYAFLTRHMKGDSFEDYDKVLDEALERGYNTIRIDPMPHVIDLSQPEKICSRGALETKPLHPWDRPQSFEGPLGEWLIEFMEKVINKNINYCLSAWSAEVEPDKKPQSLRDITDMWKVMLREWKKRFGFNNCLYVDLSNEYPYFLNDHLDRTIAKSNERWSREWNEYIKIEVNTCLSELREEFPELRFMVSLHGDVRWIDLDLELDVMDIHFYADADNRFNDRTLFGKNCGDFFVDDTLYKDFSDRCIKSHKAMAPMYRARQRNKLAAFAAWSQESGIPLLTTESWSSWYYLDHKDLDWSWLLDWAEWSVEDAIEFKMWGWTPHNYCQPQFANWKDVKWHQRLTDKFLRS